MEKALGGPGVLAERLARRIGAQGPLPLADFMAEANAAYYARGQAIGAAGDFITAPEISQVFGELIGLWAAVAWRRMGGPEPVRLVELGPGRGTLMADLLRATAAVPGFRAAIDLHLVETSPALRARQAEALAGAAATWHDTLAEVPDGPLLLVANEFFDALPIRQFQRTPDGWRERLVGLGEAGFRFVLGEAVGTPPLPAAVAKGAPPGAIAETCPAALEIAAAIGARIRTQGGAALIVDYGSVRSAPGDSFQAVRRHAYHAPLGEPGAADLTAHVDFEALANAAAAGGARPDGPETQGLWLRRLGIGARADALIANADARQRQAIASGVRRLIDAAEMGTLFKVLGLAHPALPTLPGFEAPRPLQHPSPP